MADNIHPVVELLAARMESNPEEFPVNPNGQLPIMGRWAPWLAQAEHLMNDAERTLLYTKAKEAIFQRIHEEVMDELLNGEERRRKEAEDREYERHLAQAMQHTKQQQARQLLMAQQQAYGGGGGGGAGIVGSYDYDLDRYRNTPTGHLPVANGGTAATTGTLTNTINQIKEMLGAKK
jgi:hypothetical protein